MGDVFRTLDDVLVFNDVVKHHCRIIQIEIAWIVVSIGRDRLVNELLHDTH
ncbi:Uncharacterised protein [Vibrio cholerae]|nr:Uncharacterised protein [Vibrio cholerae]